MAPHKQPQSVMYEVPHQFIDLAERRTEFLFRHLTYSDMPLRRVLACAYSQGMIDAAQALESSAASVASKR